jgi:thioredoxin reductase
MIKISIIGGGVAGYSAAMALARSHIDVNLFTGFSHGGQIVLAPHLNNYPGIETSGTQLIANMHKQVLDWKVKVYEDVAIEKICLDENLTLIDSNGNEFVNDAIIVATGKRFNKLNLPDEEKFLGRGLSYCVLCDGPLYKNEVVGVVGGGDSAVDWALLLEDIAKSVTIIHRRNDFRAQSGSVEKMESSSIKVLKNKGVLSVDKLNSKCVLTIQDNETKVQEEIESDYIFVQYGQVPSKDNFPIDKKGGLIITKEAYETSLENVFACGNIVTYPNKVRNITAGLGEVVIAITKIDQIINPTKNIPIHF